MLVRKFEKYLLFVCDIVSINFSFAFIFWLRFKSGFFLYSLDPEKEFEHYSQIVFVFSLLWILYFFLTGLYRDWYLQSRAVQLIIVSKKISVGFFFIIAITIGSDVVEAWHDGIPLHIFTPSRILSITAYWLVFLGLINGFRLSAQAFIRYLLRQGKGLERMLILGANESGATIQKQISSAPELGWKVFGYVDENVNLKGKEQNGLPILGKYSDLPALIKHYRIASIIISHDSTSHNEILRILSHVVEFPIVIFIVPDLYDAASGHFKTSAVHGMTLKILFPEHMPEWQANIKRLMDISLSALLLTMSAPLMILAALGIKLTAPGPIFYSQERIGQYGKRIWVHKFRTMRTDAEKLGPQWASQKDPRATSIGRIMRRARIDEIPQLWCVLKGDMSLVGPRPEREHFIEQLRHEVPLYLQRLKMKPGLTGWAQVKHKYDTNIEDVKNKIMFDLWYFENMSLSLDMLILFRTVWVVITGHGAQ